MPLSISDFREKIGFKKNVAPINRFEVQFTGNISFRNKQDLTYMCEMAELPGRNILTTEEKTYGPVRKIPYGSSYVETNMTFLCTSNGLEEKRFFDYWMDNITHPSSFDVNYYDSFVQDISLSMLDDTNRPIYFCTFKECYPTIVSALSLNTAATNDYAKINVTFAYRYWLRNSDVNTDISDPINTETPMTSFNLSGSN